MDWGLLGSSVHRISQVKILEWVAISFSRGSSQPRDWNCIERFFITEPPGKPQYSPERLMLIPVLGPPDARTSSLQKTLLMVKTKDKRTGGLNGHEFAHTRVSGGQRSLDCCSPPGLGLSWIQLSNWTLGGLYLSAGLFAEYPAAAGIYSQHVCVLGSWEKWHIYQYGKLLLPIGC